MKKLIILCVSFILSVQLFALSDIQLGVGGPFFNNKSGGLFSIIVENHNFISDDESIGFAESVLVTPIGYLETSLDKSLFMSFFIGPTFRKPMSDYADFIVSVGFKYSMNYLCQIDPMGLTQVIDVSNKKIYSAYSLGVDLQVKFFATKKINVVLGVPVSLGFGNLTYIQSVYTDNKNAGYKTLKNSGKFEPYFCVESLCVFVSYQF